jgi:hypothetical protein
VPSSPAAATAVDLDGWLKDRAGHQYCQLMIGYMGAQGGRRLLTDSWRRTSQPLVWNSPARSPTSKRGGAVVRVTDEMEPVEAVSIGLAKIPSTSVPRAVVRRR